MTRTFLARLLDSINGNPLNETPTMHWLLGIYMWLFIHRPFEYYPFLGDLQLERAYMLMMLVVWLVAPGKRVVLNRLHGALAGFTVALLVCWLASPWRDLCGDVVESHAKFM